MSYYLTLIGTRDNPLYETEIVSKTLSNSGSGGDAVTSPSSGSFFGPGSSSSAGGNNASTTASESGSSMFGGLLSRLPTAASSTTSAPSAPRTSTASAATSNGARRKHRYELQMIAHSSLDTIEDALATSGYLYLKSIDRIQEFTTSAFVVPGNIKFVLLHEHRHEEGIKNFFLEIWEAFLKISLNPFQDPNAPINNPTFEARVRTAARKYL